MTPDRRRFRAALLGSGVLHGAVIAVFWLASRGAAEVPRMRVYSVNIVSPPPREQGEWSPAPTGAPTDEPEVEEPDLAPAPPPEPEPEPSPAPKATTRPATPAPKETPKAAPPREEPTASPAPAPKAPAPKAGNSGTGDRSTGAEPDPTSAGGEGLDVRTEGARFVEPGYLENIVRQVNRYFRRPAGSVTDEAEIRFWINRDGSVSDISVVRSSGSFRFRTAAMEAVEQAGTRKAFGPLPSGYTADRLPVSFYFRPSR